MSTAGKRFLGVLAAGLVLILTGAIVAIAWLREQGQIPPLPFEQRCVATTPDGSVVLTVDQAHWTAIVSGVGVRHGVGVHGVTIAMATVYQETGIRNLDHGDRDSLGLFQQRPSQDWGTPAEIMDPWYSSDQFYAALVKVPGWSTGDVNDTAQAVQRSGHPEAYRKHEDNSRALAEVFTGAVPAGLTCFYERSEPGDRTGFERDVQRTFGTVDIHTDTATGRLAIPGSDPSRSWAIAAYAVANAGRLGITEVEYAGQSWTANQRALPTWHASGATNDAVLISFR